MPMQLTRRSAIVAGIVFMLVAIGLAQVRNASDADIPPAQGDEGQAAASKDREAADSRKPSSSAVLSDRSLANLQAASRLYAYLRFFHPSDEALAVQDWDQFAVELMETAETAENVDELVDRLRTFCEPIAPSLEVWAGELSDAPAEPPRPKTATAMRYWVHRGIGTLSPTTQSTASTSSLISRAARWVNFGQVYASTTEQFYVPSDPPQLDLLSSLDAIHDAVAGSDSTNPPGSPYIVKSLEAGICCRVPVQVPIESGKSLPQSHGENRWAKKVVSSAPASLDRATRFAGIATVWGVMAHFYPYFDVIHTDWDQALVEGLKKGAQDKDEREYLHTLEALVAKLHDGHGYVWNPRIRRSRTLPFTLDGSGIAWIVNGKYTSLPEEVAIGDVLVAIDGKSVAELSEKIALRISAATDGWLRYNIARRLPMEVHVDPCLVTFRHPDGTQYDVSLSLCDPSGTITGGIERPPNGAELMPGIFYFDLNGANTKALLRELPKLKKAQGIVFDMRGYPGEAAVTLMTHLIKEKSTSAKWNIPVITLPDQENWRWIESAWDLRPAAPHLDAKIVFLTDGRAISYAESIMGIVEHYKLGEIVGSTTAGTNGNVNPFQLPGGYSVSWTGMKVLKHDGSQHHGVGIRATIPIVPTAAGIADGRDEVLEKGVDVLKVAR